MFLPTDVIHAKLVSLGIPQNACFDTFADLLVALPQYLGVEIPASVTNVIISNVQPSSSQTTSLWIRLSNSGSFLGFYVFSQGTWHNIYPVNDGPVTDIMWKQTTDGVEPAGWKRILTGDTVIDPLVVAGIIGDYIQDATNTYYLYSAYYFVSF